jgi:HisJ family histidinol phosphate phosphatase
MPIMKFPPYPHDFQIHSNFSDGREELEVIVEAAVVNGLKLLCITDHAKGWQEGKTTFDFFSNSKVFTEYIKRIEILRETYRDSGVTILTGLEVEVSIDGSLRLADGILEVISDETCLKDYIDVVVGVIHSESFEEDIANNSTLDIAKKEQIHLKNIKNLILNNQIDIWGHPLQSIHGQFSRQFNSHELAEICKTLARRNDFAIELNLNPRPTYTKWNGTTNRYDRGLTVSDGAFYAKVAAHAPIVVSSDAHDLGQLNRHQILETHAGYAFVGVHE